MNRRLYIILQLLLLFGLIPTDLTKSVIPNRKYCGYQHSDDYNRQNDEISIDEFPWMVQLLYNNESVSKCSGSLISNRYVLSAAHCFKSKNLQLTSVRLGDYNVTTSQDCITTHQGELECSDSAEEYAVQEIIMHPSFNTRSKQHDIALIRLADPVTFSDFIRPICLPERDLLISNNVHNVTTSGWGLQLSEKPTEIKKRVQSSLVSFKECKNAYDSLSLRRITITEDQICAKEYNSFTCTGDSGGPLMYSAKNQWEQIGITSFAAGCGVNVFVVYAKVFNYLDWITSTIRP